MHACIERLFTDHPAEVGETYLEHLGFATRTGATLLLAGLAAIAHGALPCLFKRTSSTAVVRLAAAMQTRTAVAASPVALSTPNGGYRNA